MNAHPISGHINGNKELGSPDPISNHHEVFEMRFRNGQMATRKTSFSYLKGLLTQLYILAFGFLAFVFYHIGGF